ncbi:MAG: 5-formyltetrahydrofolate cyclo-ligase, partial [Rufibacter sp.]
MALKAELRKEYLAWRRSLPHEVLEEKSRQIADKFFTEFPPLAGQTVHTFLPIQKQQEINTWPIIQRLWKEFPEVQVAVPVTNAIDFSMTHYLLTPDSDLQKNQWGIPEPVNALPAPESEMNLVLVPLLAFDAQGHRVGYGKGFYDRFLALIPAASQKIGLGLQPPV